MSSSDSPSKRERQKQRREAKLAQQRVAEAQSRRNRMLAYAALGLILVGLVGVSVMRKVQATNAAEARAAGVQARLDELGCTPDTKMPDAGQGHLDGQTIAQQPPEALYQDRPATSGQHYDRWLMTGVYDQQIDERALVHNLEHGYVVAYYAQNADDDEVESLKAHAQEQIDGKFKKLVVAPWDGEMPGGANFAYVSWNQRQLCEQYDTDTFDVFLTAHHSNKSTAPERTLPAHLVAEGGTIDPGDDPFLLPPLSDEAPPTEAGSTNEDGATEGASEGSP